MRISDWSSDVCSSDLTLPVAVPGLASALALIVSWGTVRGLRGSLWFIVIGHVLFTLPFMVRAARASIDRKSVVSGQSGSVRVDLGGGRIIKKHTPYNQHIIHRRTSHNTTHYTT